MENRPRSSHTNGDSGSKRDIFEITPDILHRVLYGKINTHYGKGPEDIRKTCRRTLDGVSCPRGLQIVNSTIPGPAFGVMAMEPIPGGVKMGPFLGQMVYPTQLSDCLCFDLMWEVFAEDGTFSHFIDASTVSPSSRNWLTYIKCARYEEEQNMEIVQIGMKIYYQTLFDISPGQELLIWYGSKYDSFLGIPNRLKISEITENSLDSFSSPCNGLSLPKSSCIACGKLFNSKSNLRSHMRTHTQEKPFPCGYCGRRFSQSSTLKNHVRLHTGEKPYHCQICNCGYSQLAGLRAHQKSSRHRKS